MNVKRKWRPNYIEVVHRNLCLIRATYAALWWHWFRGYFRLFWSTMATIMHGRRKGKARSKYLWVVISVLRHQQTKGLIDWRTLRQKWRWCRRRWCQSLIKVIYQSSLILPLFDRSEGDVVVVVDARASLIIVVSWTGMRWPVFLCRGCCSTLFGILLRCALWLTETSERVRLSLHHRLVGLVVKASVSRAEDLGFESRLRRNFSGKRVGTPVATLALYL